MPLNLKTAEENGRRFIRSIDDHPGVLAAAHQNGTFKFAVNPTVDPSKLVANAGPGRHHQVVDEDAITLLDHTEVLAAVTDIDTFSRVSRLGQSHGTAVLDRALTEQDFDAARGAIDWMETWFDALCSRAEELDFVFGGVIRRED